MQFEKIKQKNNSPLPKENDKIMSNYVFCTVLTPDVINFTKTVISVTSSVSTTGGPLDRRRRVAFPLPTALAAAGDSAKELAPRLAVLGPIPSAK